MRKTGMTSICPPRCLETYLCVLNELGSLVVWLLSGFKQWEPNGNQAQQRYERGQDEREIGVFILPFLPYQAIV